ncbi:MAG TPA: hypothetical protein VJ300_02810 [Thermoplasmata archaeon]|nr:hypothetical protein [Thermoplasmata archaeon]
MAKRTLVATFGFDERRVLPALRLLAYDDLVLLAGRDSLRAGGYGRLKALEPSLRAVLVDPFDFSDCYRKAASTLSNLARGVRAVRLSVTGGTKILSAAALLAAFQEGVEAWFCDPDPIRLPVLRGVRVVDGIPPSAVRVADALRGSMPADRLLASAADQGLTAREARAALGQLVARGLAEERLDAGRLVVRPTPALEALRAHLPASARKG